MLRAVCTPHYHTLPGGGLTNKDCLQGLGSHDRHLRLGQAEETAGRWVSFGLGAFLGMIAGAVISGAVEESRRNG